MPFVKANGIDVHYRESGKGPRTIVFVHAIGTSLRVWDAVIERMRADWRCIAYDLRGHGRSTVTQGPYSMAMFDADLFGLMDSLRVTTATICGVSLGGMIAQQAALDGPHRIDGLVLCDTGAKIGTPAGWQDRIRLVTERGLAAASVDITARWYNPGFCANQPALCESLRLDLAAMSPAGYVGACHALGDADFSRDLGHIRMPAVVVCGADDIATPPAVARELASSIPGARLEIIPGAGHLPCVETPQRVADLIDSLFVEVPRV